MSFEIKDSVLIKYTGGEQDTVVIPEGVTSIAQFAFSPWEDVIDSMDNFGHVLDNYGSGARIKQLILPESLERIDDYAFYQMYSLVDIELPQGLKSIGTCAFEKCTFLKSIVIPEGIKTVETACFCDCDMLESVKLPDSLTAIEGCAFYRCDMLHDIKLPQGLKMIGLDAFALSGLQEIYIPDSVCELWDGIFRFCKKLKKVRLPESMEAIPSYFFECCTSLREIEIPDGVKSIGYEAFRRCESLTRVSIPESVKAIYKQAFYGCTELKTIHLSKGIKLGEQCFAPEHDVRIKWSGLPYVSSSSTIIKMAALRGMAEYAGNGGDVSGAVAESYLKYLRRIRMRDAVTGSPLLLEYALRNALYSSAQLDKLIEGTDSVEMRAMLLMHKNELMATKRKAI